MKSTGIVRRIDELGRVVIPKDIRFKMHIHEHDPLEIFTERDAVCFKKYGADEEAFSQACAKWVQEHKNDILAVNFMNGTTTVIFQYDDQTRTFSVKYNPTDKFDINVAICYAAERCGFKMFDGFKG